MKKSYSIKAADEGMRIDRWIRKEIGKIPQGLIEKKLRNGNVKLNKKKIKSSYKIKRDDIIELFNFNLVDIKKISKKKFNPTTEIIKKNENHIIENNNNFIVLNKESGISVQGGTKSKKNLIDIFSKSKFFEDTKPYTVHRLDKDTSGVFIIAKNRETAQIFTSLFRLRKIHKTYLAICQGEIAESNGIWKHKLIRKDNNKTISETAITKFKVLDKNSFSSLVEMQPITGRKHQLRKQLFILGHPIFGDNKYKSFESNKSVNKNLMLHSYKIKFILNNSKHTYVALLPNYFNIFLRKKRLTYSNLK